jgi:hypothetical protein
MVIPQVLPQVKLNSNNVIFQARSSSLSPLASHDPSAADSSSKLYSAPACSPSHSTIESQEKEDSEAARLPFSQELWTKLERHLTHPNGTWAKELQWTKEVLRGKTLMGLADTRLFFENTGHEIFELDDEN